MCEPLLVGGGDGLASGGLGDGEARGGGLGSERGDGLGGGLDGEEAVVVVGTIVVEVHRPSAPCVVAEKPSGQRATQRVGPPKTPRSAVQAHDCLAQDAVVKMRPPAGVAQSSKVRVTDAESLLDDVTVTPAPQDVGTAVLKQEVTIVSPSTTTWIGVYGAAQP